MSGTDVGQGGLGCSNPNGVSGVDTQVPPLQGAHFVHRDIVVLLTVGLGFLVTMKGNYDATT